MKSLVQCFWVLFFFAVGELIGMMIGHFLPGSVIGLIPVSYTHLDVYKRQVKEALIGKQESMPKPTESISQISEIDYKKPYLLQSDAIKSNYVMADDCNPLPGDEVVAFVIDNQVVVHRRTCTEAMRLKSSTGNKLLSTIWGDQGDTLFTGSIMIEGIDSKGILNGIVQVITEDFLINIASVQLQTQDGIFGGKVGLEVHSAEQVEQLCAALKQAPGISNAYRVY